MSTFFSKISTLRKRTFLLYIISIPFPLFFNLNGSIFQGASFGIDVFALPVSLIVGFFLLVLNPDILKFCFLKSPRIVLFFLLFQLVVFLLYIIFMNGNGDPLLLLISNIPFFISYNFGIYIKANFSNQLVADMFRTSISVLGIVALLHLISSVLQYGFLGSFAVRGTDDIFGLFSIYQKLVYYPTIISLFFVLSLYYKGFKMRLLSVLLGLDVLMIGSRESFVILFFGFLSLLFWTYLTKRTKHLPLMIICLVIIIFVLFYSFDSLLNVFSESAVVTKFKSIGNQGDYSGGRGDVINLVFSKERKDISLLIGTGYNNVNTLSPHNQYLEILVRGGILSLLIFIYLLTIIFKRFRQSLKIFNFEEFKPEFSLYVTLFLLFLISFNVNTPVRAPYSACFIGFLIGYLIFKNPKYENSTIPAQ